MSKKLDVFALKKLLHILIKKGKKQIALNAYLNLLRDLNKSNKRLSAADIFQEAFNNIKPILSIQKVKKSSKVFYLPKIINVEQRTNLSLFWLLKSINARKERTLDLRLQNEFLDCFSGKSLTISKKQAVYDTIKVNRPFLNLLIYK